MTDALRDVITERAKQIAKWGNAHDDEHDDGALAAVAGHMATGVIPDDGSLPEWGDALYRKHAGNHRQRLVIAAALLIAEIERLDRKEPKS